MPIRCFKCDKREGVAVPVMVIPITNYPIPAYMHLKGALCRECAAAFTMQSYTDYDGSWYEMVCDEIRAKRQEAANPYKGIDFIIGPSGEKVPVGEFKFEDEGKILEPDWNPAPREQCTLQFWTVKVLEGKGMQQRLWE